MQTVYEAAGDREGLLKLAHAWHGDVGLAYDEHLRRVLHDYFAGPPQPGWRVMTYQTKCPNGMDIRSGRGMDLLKDTRM